MDLPLDGIRVIELCTGAAGPTVAKSLGEYGAEVLRIETRDRPDTHRGGGNKARWNKSPSFVKLHRNKKSVTINMRTERGKELLADLIRHSDVVVENFSLGVVDRWGFTYERMRELKPDIILISLKGLGNTGPYASHVTWGPNLLCLFGLTYLWNDPRSDAPTGEARVQHPDFMSGVAGAAAVMAALLYRDRTGKGQYIDGAQIEGGAYLLGPYYLDYIVNGRISEPAGNDRAGAAPYGSYPCAGDDQWCAISVRSQEEWEHFRQAIGAPGWTADERFATPLSRRHNRGELDRLVGEWTAEHLPNEVMAVLQGAGVAAAPILDVEGQLADPHFAERGLFVSLDEPEMGPVLTERPPVLLSETPPQIRVHAPLLGEHTDQTLRDVLHLDEPTIAQLTEEGVLR
jgi:crotonobetainyl-CoA:carnitine CoA-transferase CaiB-like acyl-CoA transferase